MISCIILAAGASSRFGELKPLYQVNGKSFLEIILDRIGPLTQDKEIIIGIGYEYKRVLDELKRIGFQGSVAINEHYEKGPLSTLQTCVRRSSLKSRCFLLILSDHPFVEYRTYQSLLADAEQDAFRFLVIPVFQEKKGHPIVLPGLLRDEILSLPAEKSIRNIIKNHENMIKWLAVDDGAILADMDDKEMLKRYFKEI